MNGQSPVILTRNHGHLECDVVAIPDWEGLEKIARFLEKYYGATTERKIDGPDARRWILSVDGEVLEIHHEDPWGNVIVAPQKSAEELLEKISRDLESRLSKK